MGVNMFATFATPLISSIDIINMILGITLILDIFQLDFTVWHTLPGVNRTIGNTWDWWQHGVQDKLRSEWIERRNKRAQRHHREF